MSYGIGRASALLASGTIVSRLLGFARAVLLTVVIGNIGHVADAYNQATFVPNSIYALIGGGLLTAGLVPQIIRASTNHEGGPAYLHKLVTIAVLGSAGIPAVVTLAAPPLMRLYVGSEAVL